MRNRTRVAHEKAARLRAEGLSLAEIGERMGFSKQYAAKLLKDAPLAKSRKSAESKSTGSVNRMTPRQLKFAKGLAEGKSKRTAALDAVPTGGLTDKSADTWAARTLRNEGFRRSFEQILSENGLSDEDIARVHRENLAATKIVATASQDGQITDVLEHPDYPVRQRAVADAWRIRGRMNSLSEPEPQRPPRIIVLSQADAELFRVFTGGLPLPDSFQVAPEGVATTMLEAAETVDTSAEVLTSRAEIDGP